MKLVFSYLLLTIARLQITYLLKSIMKRFVVNLQAVLPLHRINKKFGTIIWYMTYGLIKRWLLDDSKIFISRLQSPNCECRLRPIKR